MIILDRSSIVKYYSYFLYIALRQERLLMVLTSKKGVGSMIVEGVDVDNLLHLSYNMRPEY